MSLDNSSSVGRMLEMPAITLQTKKQRAYHPFSFRRYQKGLLIPFMNNLAFI
jgi:hypothetical protein